MSSFKHYIAILAISLLPFVFILTTADLPHTHDGGVHLPRIAAYVKALRDGHIPVRWAGDLNYGYGLPLFNFMYQTPYALGSLFVFLGLSLVNSFKVILVISFLLSGIFMYRFSELFFKNKEKALLATVFYQFAPFRLIELFTRGSIGSIYAYTFLPLVLSGIISRSFLVTAFATFFLILSHNALSLVFFGICVLFAIIFSQKRMIFALILGLMLSAFYWLPAIFEHKYTYGDLYMKNVYLEHFPPFFQFVIPNLTNNPTLNTAKISMQFGAFHVLAILLSLYLLWKKKIRDVRLKKLIWFCIFFIGTSVFFMQPVSIVFWKNISYLRQFQFPWRLLAVPAFATSLLAVSFLSLHTFKKRLFFWVLLAGTIALTIVFWYPPEGFDRNTNENDYWNYPLNTTYFGETDVIWSAGPAKGFPKNRIEVISGAATVSNFVKKTQLHTFTVTAQSKTTLVDNTQYYPGWRVYVDNQKVPIQFQDANWRGLITFQVPQGTHSVRVLFGETPMRLAADLMSVITLFVLLLSSFFRRFKFVS